MVLCPFRGGHSRPLYLYEYIIPLSSAKVKINPSILPKISGSIVGKLGESLDFFGDFAYNSREDELQFIGLKPDKLLMKNE